MKWLLHVLVVSLSFCLVAHGQGTIVFNNLGPKDIKVDLFDSVGAHTLLNQDLNFSLSTDRGFGNKLLERSWLLSDGTAKGINVGPGLFADPTHSVIVLAGIAPGADVNVIVAAWGGNYPTFIAGAPAASSTPFLMTAGSVTVPPSSLQGFGGLAVGVIPEPRTVTLATLGAALFFSNCILRRLMSNAA